MSAATAVETPGRTTRAGVERVGAAAAFVADTLSRLLDDSSLYVGSDSLVLALRGLVTDIRANPKKFFSVRPF